MVDEWMPKPPHNKTSREGKRWQLRWTVDRLEERGLPEWLADGLRERIDDGKLDDV